MTDAQHSPGLHPAGDRRRARPLHHRSGRREARGCDRAPQSLAPADACREELRDEIVPKNILMIGPTGVGKTEIARRLAKLIKAPFVKVEASKFTEVGYVGRDVESMVRDLVEVGRESSCARKRKRRVQGPRRRGGGRASARLAAAEPLEAPALRPTNRGFSADTLMTTAESESKTRETFRRMLREGKLDDRFVEVEVSGKPAVSMVQNFSTEGVQDMVFQLQDLLGGKGNAPKKRRKLTVTEAREIVLTEEVNKRIDTEQVNRDALALAGESGIIFIDEIDKVAKAVTSKSGPDISREGVQRDLLPIVEGSTVSTKYGRIKTDHVLFIAAGAFHTTKVSDLIPELQGRFPIRVELKALTGDDFVRILTEPKNSLVRQYCALLATEGIEMTFTDDAVAEIAAIAARVNDTQENIGARRLHTVMETLLEALSFEAPECSETSVVVDREFVLRRLAPVLESEDLSRFVL